MTSDSRRHLTPSTSRSDFEDGGKFESDTMITLECGCTTLLVVATGDDDLTELGPVIREVEEGLVAIFFKKTHVDAMFEFFDDASDQPGSDDVIGEFIGAMAQHSVMAYNRWQLHDGTTS